jgi:hypothetical protein
MRRNGINTIGTIREYAVQLAAYVAALVVTTRMTWACVMWTSTGSVYRDPCLHVGVRPASDGLGDYAATVQVSADPGLPCHAGKDDGPMHEQTREP